MRYVCQICSYVYDDTKEKIPFVELPDDWKCPLCGASKSDFKAEVVEVVAASVTASTTAKVEASVIPAEENYAKLSTGQLAALCSNLARGCEKQYMSEEAGLFQQLADYFTTVTPIVDDASVEKLIGLLQKDSTEYAQVRAIADEYGDRGAARVCVWGEKVTRILSSLVSRYLNEGEKMLAETNIWVCTVCGFVYVGDIAPELCPVCKVPNWKFQKINGRA